MNEDRTNDENQTYQHKKVFISYSHDTIEHKRHVLELSERLRADGVETGLDQYVKGTQHQKWPRWMLDQVDWADYVICICTETYYRRFRGHEEPGTGKGVDWEGAIITQEIYDSKTRTVKFVPVMFEPAYTQFIPEPLRGDTYYVLNNEPEYERLYDFLLDQGGVEPRPIGKPRLKERQRIEPIKWEDAPPRYQQTPKEITIPKPFLEKWASNTGKDEYGKWDSFTVNGVRCTLRWISPGTFLMGSPESEPERENDEKQHEVVITEGFWLAETACTQALWQEIMGENPSRFKGENLPVESVTWKECQQFIQKINERKPGLDLRLPTEAEWEYACRAGTITPFSFGKNITTGEVNYDGNHPYNNAKKGEYREKSVAVKSLPCNNWGLYEMHGNVWEWCNDWYAAYPSATRMDPHGPDTGTYRVLRGGSWYSNARYCRSAYRNDRGPGNRGGRFGLRFVRGQQKTGTR